MKGAPLLLDLVRELSLHDPRALRSLDNSSSFDLMALELSEAAPWLNLGRLGLVEIGLRPIELPPAIDIGAGWAVHQF